MYSPLSCPLSCPLGMGLMMGEMGERGMIHCGGSAGTWSPPVCWHTSYLEGVVGVLSLK